MLSGRGSHRRPNPRFGRHSGPREPRTHNKRHDFQRSSPAESTAVCPVKNGVVVSACGNRRHRAEGDSPCTLTTSEHPKQPADHGRPHRACCNFRHGPKILSLPRTLTRRADDGYCATVPQAGLRVMGPTRACRQIANSGARARRAPSYMQESLLSGKRAYITFWQCTYRILH